MGLAIINDVHNYGVHAFCEISPRTLLALFALCSSLDDVRHRNDGWRSLRHRRIWNLLYLLDFERCVAAQVVDRYFQAYSRGRNYV